ncbi:MAG: protein kinase [Myxococcota bacterium]|nr:protein kinase [Myxococcota bacterium]
MNPLPFGKYLLLERLSAGLLAEVFIGKEPGLGDLQRLVAIKRLQPTAAHDDEVKSAFLDEARISLALSHANVVHVVEVAQAEDSYFLAMEYVSGRSLAQVLEHQHRLGRPMSVGQALFVAVKICEGLDYAHRRKDSRGKELGIVHRGVSPRNVLISYDGEVKLIDFGLAKASNRLQKTQVGVLKGKVGYLSPEQVRGEAVDRRSDIFAVGTVLYEMLTGIRPFEAESDFALMERVARADFTPATLVNPELPDTVDALLGVALSPVAAERYQNAAQFAEDLTKYLLAEETPYSTNLLSDWMQHSFAKDLVAEQERLRRYSEVVLPAGGAPRSATPPGKTRPRLATPAPAPKAPAPAPLREAFETDYELDEDDRTLNELPERTQVVNLASLSGAPPAPRPLPVLESADGVVSGGMMPWSEDPPRSVGAPFADSVPFDFAGLPAASTPPPRRSRTALFAALGVGLLAVLGGAGWWAQSLQSAAAPLEVPVASSTAVVVVKVTPTVEPTQVTLSGRLVQPGVSASFPAGDYDLVVTAPGYKQHSQRVKVFEDEKQAILSVFLEEEKKEQPEVLPTFTAVFEAPNGARVYLDGQLIGTAPGVRAEGLEVNRAYRYRAEKDGFVPQSDQLSSSLVGERMVKVEMTPLPRPSRSRAAASGSSRAQKGRGFLLVTSEPDGAAVWVDGKPTSRRTPILPSNPLVVAVGTRKILIEVGGISSELLVVEVREGETVSLEDVVLDQLAEL